MRNIKNQCVDLFSSLIEIFGDHAVQTILIVINNLLGLPCPTSDLKNESEDLSEQLYHSKNKLHEFKTRDVALILLGLFNEDI